MPNQPSTSTPESPPQQAQPAWSRPGFELISLDCEITAYAPDGDQPLF
jgi:hypothetical protein